MKTSKPWTLIGAFAEFYLALTAFCTYLILALFTGQPEWAGLGIFLSAVLGMNGLSRTDMALKNEGEHWWHRHSVLKPLHFITNEGELCGILVGVIVTAVLYATERGELATNTLTHATAPAFALLGIMAAARFAAVHIKPILETVEVAFGRRVAVATGSLLASLTGEPAAAVFLSKFVQDRVSEDDKPAVAVGLAATIGSGGGLMPYAAPPILIVWSVLHTKLGWNIADLIMYVGGGCVLHVLVSSWWFVKKIQKNTTKTEASFTVGAFFSLATLAALIIGHVTIPNNHMLWACDILIALLASLSAYRQQWSEPEQRFTAAFQHWILAALLVALDIIGLEVEPLIRLGVEMVPQSLHPMWIGVIIFFSTAVVSHFADNALASRVFMVAPVTMMAQFSPTVVSCLAACVVMGALFGGFLTVPANLPNFELKRALQVSEGSWFRAGTLLYLSVFAYLIWIWFIFTMYT